MKNSDWALGERRERVPPRAGLGNIHHYQNGDIEVQVNRKEDSVPPG